MCAFSCVFCFPENLHPSTEQLYRMPSCSLLMWRPNVALLFLLTWQMLQINSFWDSLIFRSTSELFLGVVWYLCFDFLCSSIASFVGDWKSQKGQTILVSLCFNFLWISSCPLWPLNVKSHWSQKWIFSECLSWTCCAKMNLCAKSFPHSSHNLLRFNVLIVTSYSNYRKMHIKLYIF